MYRMYRMKKVTDIYFKNIQDKCIVITKYGATLVNNNKKHNISFNKTSLKLAINYLIEVFQYWGLTFRLTISIPVGFDPAPFMVNLLLFTYESKWLLHNKKSNLQKARKLANTFRFTYYFLPINDSSEIASKKYTHQN